MKLPVNMGTVDRIVRAVVALVLLALALTNVITGVAATIAIVIGVVFLLTAVVRFCPLYALFKLSTSKA